MDGVSGSVADGWTQMNQAGGVDVVGEEKEKEVCSG